MIRTHSGHASASEGIREWTQAGRPHASAANGVGVSIEAVEALAIPAIAECAEAVIDGLDAAAVASPALLDALVLAPSSVGASRHIIPRQAAVPCTIARPVDNRAGRCPPGDSHDSGREAGVVSLDEYAKAVLFNGLGHYQAAREAASRACECEEFELLDGALAELVEASVRSGCQDGAAAALARLERRCEGGRSTWATGISACARALMSGDDAEPGYLEAIDLLISSEARVSLARARLLYGEWLRRQGRRVDARRNLAFAHETFRAVGLGGFADRAYRELLATGQTVRKRTDDTRLELTEREKQIARLAAARRTNPEIGEQLFLSSRTVEWHLRKIFSKLGISSRRELNAFLEPVTDVWS